jgi:hypothetical protein
MLTVVTMADDSTPQNAIATDPVEAQRRQHPRKRVMWAGKIEIVALPPTDCVAVDVSLCGAKLRAQKPLPLKRKVRLKIDRFGAAPLHAAIVWQNGEAVGLQFLDPPERVRQFFAGTLVL